MAGNINASDAIFALLHEYYADGVQSLFFRNSPVVNELKKERVEGKSYNFSAMVGHGGAVGGNFVEAKKNAANASRAVEFAVTPGKLFSVYTMTAQEVEASKTQKGAYMPIAGAKMFAASEAFRKTMAAAFYGRGFGELCKTNYSTPITGSSAFKLTLPSSAIMSIDIDSVLDLKKTVAAKKVETKLTVQKIEGNEVTVMPDTSVGSPAATDVICLHGSMDEAGKPVLPMGLGGWLPTIAKRTGGTWTTYIDQDFFNVARSMNPDKLAGAFYDGSNEPNGVGKKPYQAAVQKLIAKCRRQGSVADLIVMNDEDFMAFADEVATSNTYMTATSTKAKKEANVGFDSFSASFSTNYINNIYDDPYCHKGIFYVLDREYVKLISYTDAKKTETSVVANNPGKENPMEAANDGQEDKPAGLIIDDYLNIKPGDDTAEGPSTMVSLLFYGSFIITNPSCCGVGLFRDANLIEA